MKINSSSCKRPARVFHEYNLQMSLFLAFLT